MSIQFENTGLRDLIESFVQDPFVAEQNLQELTLEEIGTFFEGQQEEEHTDVQGFERAKSHYCLILLELELLGYSTPHDKTLRSFFEEIGGNKPKSLDFPHELPDTPFPLNDIALNDLVLPGGDNLEKTVSKEISSSTLINNLQSTTGKAYFELSRTMTFPGSFPRSVRLEDLERLHSQCQIWALECELYHRLKISLTHFWPQRDTHISRVICQNGHAYDFHPSLKEGLEKFAKDHPEWLYENKFPIAGIMSSLRYLLSVSTLEKLVPASIDFAALLLLFGRNAEYGPQLVYNVLEIQGLRPEELLELSARLFRIQRIKAKILNPHQPLFSELLDTVKSDATAAFALALRIETRSMGSSTKEVA